MIDALDEIRDFLVANSTYTTAVSGGTYAGRSTPPVGYKPSDGACCVFTGRGGAADYEDALLVPDLQFKVYGASELAANTAYRALYDRFHDGRDANLIHAEIVTLGQTLEEPDTGWYFVLCYGFAMLRQD